MDKRSFFQDLFKLSQSGKASDGLRRMLGADTTAKLERLVSEERTTNPPKVAVIGKAGVGKTTTVNSLFSAEFHISHALRGTDRAQLKEFSLRGGGSLHVVDMPGLGEGIAEDAIFEEIYRTELPKADVVLYVLEADERLLGEDQRIFTDVIIPALNGQTKRLVVGLNKVDLLGPGSWDTVLNYPDEKQEKAIERRCTDIASKLARQVRGLRPDSIAYYSAERLYRLEDLLIILIEAAGKAAWKLPVNPRPWHELAAPEVRDFVREWQAEHEEV